MGIVFRVFPEISVLSKASNGFCLAANQRRGQPGPPIWGSQATGWTPSWCSFLEIFNSQKKPENFRVSRGPRTSLKLTVQKHPENGPGPKRKGLSSTYAFLGAMFSFRECIVGTQMYVNCFFLNSNSSTQFTVIKVSWPYIDVTSLFLCFSLVFCFLVFKSPI